MKDRLGECEEETEYLFLWESLVSSLSTTGVRNLRKFGTEEEECNLALKPLSPDGLRDRAWEKEGKRERPQSKGVKQRVTVMYNLIGLKQHKSEIYPVLVELKLRRHWGEFTQQWYFGANACVLFTKLNNWNKMKYKY